ncbi:hypothetical protein RJ639_027625 [Escallonia herrerae]|uniref:CST complex subunit CTC1 n=1 Tax=Escallonia herrerae TaxID=1293975 RepID=A0AA89BPP2_9ASTE|nr:hypothetical protein RJ639_027625 [Escallonia herrerae]
MEMEGESAKLLSISDLVKRRRPVTGASSLNPSRPISNNEPHPSGEPIKPSNPTNPSSQNPNPRALTPLNYPAVLIGTLALPNQNNPSTSNSDTHGPITGCFSFSDDSAVVCCDVLHLDVRIIGKKIRVLAWNYIPFKSGSGLLEIIKWSLLESLSGLTRCTNSNLNAFSLLSGSDVDCKGIGNARNTKIITGVLDSISPVSVVPCTIGSNSGGTSNLCGFLSQILVCECTLCSSNNLVVEIQDLTNRQGSHCFRKPVIVYFYGSGSYWHPVITRLVGSVVSLSGLKKKLVFIGKEESQLMYVTTEKALLHLTRSSNQCHRFQKASIEGNVKCGVYTGVITGIYMQGMVVELDQEVLLLLTDHQLILPHSLRIGAIHGVFTEFCKHDLCGCGDEPDHGHQKLMVPLSSFIRHCEETWANMLLKRETYSGILENGNQTCPVFCEGKSHGQTFRQILKSEDIGVVLIGSLKVNNFIVVVEGMLAQADYRKGCFEELENGRFHMLQITHKFPFLQKNDQDISKWSRIVAEAIVLPWDLLLTGKDGDTNLTRISADCVRDLMENCGSRSHHERIKRFKVEPASSGSSAYKESYGECKIRVMSYPLDTSCAVDGGSVNGHCLISSGTLLHRDRIYLEASSRCKPGGRIVLLEFESESFCEYELSRIGGYYLIKHHKDDIFCHEDPNDASSDTALITSRTHLWSFSFSSDEVLSNKGQSPIIPFDDSYVSNKDALSEDSRQIELPHAKFGRACPELCSDINITLSPDVLNLLAVDLKELEEAYIRPLVSLEDVPSTSGLRITAEAQFCGSSDSDHLLPEGNLISVHGQVVDVHNHDNCPLVLHSKHERSADVHPLNFVQGVRIFSSLPEHAYPLGFGPGVTATFYRVLVLGQNEIMLIPASFIVINSIIVSNNQFRDGCNSPSAASGLHNVALETLPTALISEIVQCLEHKQTQLHCKVAAVYVLILEKNRKVVSHHQLLPSVSPVVKIPLAGFVLDDGSSSCCCWTSDERAATLLRVQEGNQREASGGNISRTKKTVIGQPGSSIRSRLDKILEQHGRVVVKNYGSMYDSSCQDLTICVGSELAISSSDEEFLKLMILNACFSTFWTVVGSLMKSDALGRLERRLMKLDLTMPTLQNVWATEVRRSNALAEARNVMEELLNS